MVKKYSYIDSLRGFAVLAVILVHTGLRFDNLPQWLKSITDHGARGVQLFFVLSALTLFLSMKQRSATGQDSKLDFYIRRFFRIAPMFYLAAFVYSARDLLLNKYTSGGYPDFDPFNFVSTLLLVTNQFNPSWINSVVPGGWSITVEMSFYLMVPFLFFKIKTLKGAINLTLITFLIAFICNAIFYSMANDSVEKITIESYLFYWLPNQLPVFALGVLVFFVIEKTQNVALNRKLGYIGIWLSVVSLLILPLTSIPYNFIHFVFSGVFVLLVWLFSKTPSKLFVNKFTVLVGKLSFSMYLTHFIVLQLVGELTGRLGLSAFIELPLLYFLTVIVTAGVSYVSYNMVEKKGIKLGNFLIEKLKRYSTNTKRVEKIS